MHCGTEPPRWGLARVAGIVAGAVAVTCLLGTPAAFANAPQDLFGASARQVAMGGAGIASALDYSATFYNPANLAMCPNASGTFMLRRTNLNLSLDSANEVVAMTERQTRTNIDVGLCTLLPANLAFGFYFGTTLEAPQRFQQNSVDFYPRYTLYGVKQDQLSIQMGFAYRPIPRLSFGAGVAVLVNSDLDLTIGVPVLTPDETVETEIEWGLIPRAAPYFGVAFEATPELRLGVVYRGALYHFLDAVALTQVDALGIDLQIDLLLESVAWYSPQQFGGGFSMQAMPELEIAADITWYNWSNDPGPFIVASPYNNSTVAEALEYPSPYISNYRNVIVPRFGAEYVIDDVIELRAG